MYFILLGKLQHARIVNLLVKMNLIFYSSYSSVIGLNKSCLEFLHPVEICQIRVRDPGAHLQDMTKRNHWDIIIVEY